MSKSQGWELCTTSGDTFQPHVEHSVVNYKNQIFVFGGIAGNCRFNSLYYLNTKTLEWKEIRTTGKLPSARAAHSANVYRDAMYVVGGYDRQGTASGVFKFNFLDLTWDLISDSNLSRRFHHTSIVFKNSLIIFGGYAVGASDELIRFCIADNSWTVIPTEGEKPDKRFEHTAVEHENSMYVFGGYSSGWRTDLWELNLETMKWKEIQTPNSLSVWPEKRSAHAAVVIDGKMVIIGGAASSCPEDLRECVFHCRKKQWEKVSKTMELTNIMYHKAVAVNEWIFVIGGQSHDNSQNFVHNRVYRKQLIPKGLFTVNSMKSVITLKDVSFHFFALK